MTREMLVWEPPETDFAEEEDEMTDFRGEVIRSRTMKGENGS